MANSHSPMITRKIPKNCKRKYSLSEHLLKKEAIAIHPIIRGIKGKTKIIGKIRNSACSMKTTGILTIKVKYLFSPLPV